MRGLGPFLRDTWRLAKPYFNSEERWFARGMLAVVLALNLFTVGLNVVFNFWNNAFYNSLQDKDWHSFLALLLTYQPRKNLIGFLPGFVWLAAVFILVAVYRTYLNQWLRIRWRRWLTARFMDEWLADRAYYRISLQTESATSAKLGTDNPDQRISEDVRDFVTTTLVLGLDLLSNIVTLFSFFGILWTLSGPLHVFGVTIPGYMVWVALIYSVFGSVITHYVGRPLAMLNFNQQRVEADFRFGLVRLRENVEGIALYGGEEEEKLALSERFRHIMANWWRIMQRTKLLNSIVAGYSQVANIFPIVVASPRYFAGTLQLGGLMQISDAFGQVQGAMSWLVNNYSELAGWRAIVERLATFDRAIAAARAAAGTGVTAETELGDGYALHDATIALPNGEALLTHENLVLPPNRSVVISGRSGTGKSTLFRALAGIWPFGKGHVQRPRGRVLFLPQRPYIPLGTLRRALTYPHAADAYDDAAVRAALEDAGLAKLEDRLDAEENWAQRLSGGEQQRLAIGRALLQQPDWLFLDEATASLDPEAETELYTALRGRLPRTTIISIAHRPALAGHHDAQLRFERPPGRLVEIGTPARTEVLERDALPAEHESGAVP